MNPPFELPVRANDIVLLDANSNHLADFVLNTEIDYIVAAINSHEKLVDLAEDLKMGLRYLRRTKAEPYGFGIDRLEKKLQALKEAGEPE